VTRAAILPQIKTSDRITPGVSSYQSPSSSRKVSQGAGTGIGYAAPDYVDQWISGSVDQWISGSTDHQSQRWPGSGFKNSVGRSKVREQRTFNPRKHTRPSYHSTRVTKPAQLLLLLQKGAKRCQIYLRGRHAESSTRE
jgi:hypothetical protein